MINVKWKGYENSFDSWIDKKDIVFKMSYFREPHTHSYLVKKTDYNKKINQIEKKITDHDHGKYTQEFNKLTADNFAAKLKQASFSKQKWCCWFCKEDFVKYFDDKLKNLNKKITSNKRKHVLIQNELKSEQVKIKKLQTFDSSLFIGQSCFFNDRLQNFLIFQPIFDSFVIPAGHTETIIAWKSKGLSNEMIKPPTTANYNLSPKLNWHNSKIREEFKGRCLKKDKVIFTPNNVVNLFILYDLNKWSQDLNANFNLKGCLLEAVKLTKNADPCK